MNLPVFDIPVPNFGFDIPVLLHPPLVHFAIVIPVFILILEIINIFMKRKGLTVTTVVFFSLLVIIFFAAFVTGKTDGSETWDLLTKAGKADLQEHKLIGIYLLLGSVAILFLKLFAVALRTWWMKLIYMLLLIGFVGAVLYQGKEGGELVFKHGANNERVQDLMSDMDDLKDEIAELKEDAGTDEESEASDEEETQKAPQATESAKEETKEETSTPAPAAEKTEKSEEKADEPKKEETSAATENAAQTVKAVKESAKETAHKVAEKTSEVAKKVTETAQKAVDSAKEAGSAVMDAAKKMVTPETTQP